MKILAPRQHQREVRECVALMQLVKAAKKKNAAAPSSGGVTARGPTPRVKLPID